MDPISKYIDRERLSWAYRIAVSAAVIVIVPFTMVTVLAQTADQNAAPPAGDETTDDSTGQAGMTEEDLTETVPPADTSSSASAAAPVIISGPSVPAEMITETSAVVTWTTDALSTSVVDFGISASLGQTYRKIIPLEETEVREISHAITLWELQPGTTYHYRVRSVSESGLTATSGIGTFTTKGLPPSEEVAHPALSKVSIIQPSSGEAVTGGFDIRVRTEGPPAGDISVPVSVSVAPAAGGPGESFRADPSTEQADVWTVSGVSREPGDHIITASAQGYDDQGAAVTIQAAPVTISVIPEPEPEPAPEPKPATETAPKQPTVSEDGAGAVTAGPQKSRMISSEKPGEKMRRSVSLTPVGVIDAAAVLQQAIVSGRMTVQAPSTVGATIGVHAYGSTGADAEVPEISEELEESIGEFIMETGGTAAGTVTSGKMGEADISVIAAEECTANDVPAETCAAWLAARYADETCAAAGHTTKESCEKYLLETSQGVFPGCDGLDEAACNKIKALATMSYPAEDVVAKADRVIERAVEEEVFVELPGMTPVPHHLVGQTRWRESVRKEETRVSAAVAMLDADLDGLPDDYEKAHGWAWDDPDSDGDGVNDAEELGQGSDPAGEGELDRALDPTEQALVSGRPLEQPRGAGVVDEGLTAAAGSGDILTLDGRCDPGASCLLYVYSYVPMVLTTQADVDGNWSYELADTLTDGDHTVYVVVTDDTGKVVRKSNPLALFVREARAVTQADFLEATLAPEVNVPETPAAASQRRYVYLAAILILVAAIVSLRFVRRTMKKA